LPNPVLMAAARSTSIRRLVTAAPITRRVVERFVAGERLEDVLETTRSLVDDGLTVTLDHLGENSADPAQWQAVTEAYVALLARLGDAGLSARAEVSVKLSALGQGVRGDERRALENASRICSAAADVGTTVTVDMEDHTTVDSTLGIVRELRADFPWVGAVVQSALRRTEADCRDLAHEGSRVRLVKGAYAEPASVAHTSKHHVDAAFDRCLEILMAGSGYPMVGSHDPARISHAEKLVRFHERPATSYEFQMLYGIRLVEQYRIAASGRRLRVYTPYGDDWYGYFMRRLAERPANVAFFLRSLVSR
jgi:proline dehydrogenase